MRGKLAGDTPPAEPEDERVEGAGDGEVPGTVAITPSILWQP
jgi:hypothetical protein